MREILERLGRLPPEVREHVLDLAVSLHARAQSLDVGSENGALDTRLRLDSATAATTALDPRAGPDERRQAVVDLVELAGRGAHWAQRAEALHAREQALDRREAQLDARAAALDQLEGVEPAWTVPAAPAAAQLRALIIDTGDDVATVAQGIGVDAGWARGVLSGDITEITVADVQHLCEGLHCTPYDLLGAETARSIVHAYGPELWPRYIEPLEPTGLEGPGIDPDPPPVDLDL